MIMMLSVAILNCLLGFRDYGAHMCAQHLEWYDDADNKLPPCLKANSEQLRGRSGQTARAKMATSGATSTDILEPSNRGPMTVQKASHDWMLTGHSVKPEMSTTQCLALPLYVLNAALQCLSDFAHMKGACCGTASTASLFHRAELQSIYERGLLQAPQDGMVPDPDIDLEALDPLASLFLEIFLGRCRASSI